MTRSWMLAALVAASLSGTAWAEPCAPESAGGVETLAEAVHGWRRYDAQSVVDSNGVVDHRASARANFAMVKDEWYSLTHLDKIAANRALIEGLPILGAIIGTVIAPVAVIADGLDLVVRPPLIVKHVSDGLVHGALGLFQPRRRDAGRPR